MKTKSTAINLINLEKRIVKAFCLLNTSPLEKLNEKAIYSFNYKDEMIAELQSVFDKIKSTGVQKLKIQSVNTVIHLLMHIVFITQKQESLLLDM